MPLNEEPRMDRNYWLALALSMLVLMGYSLFLQKIPPPSRVSPKVSESEPPGTEPSPVVEKGAEEASAASREEGRFIEPPQKPTTHSYKNDLYDIELTDLGGTMTRLAYMGEAHRSGLSAMVFYDGDPAEPGLMGLRLLNEAGDLTRTLFKAQTLESGHDGLEFVYEKPEEYRVIKRFFFGSHDPIIALDIVLQNLSNRERVFPLELTYALSAAPQNGRPQTAEAVVSTAKIQTVPFSKVSKKGFSVSELIQWSGLLKKYFAVLVKPDLKAIHHDARTQGNVLWASVRLEPVTVLPGQELTRQVFIYAGPQRYEILKSFNVGFEQVLSRGVLGFFKIILLRSLKYFDQYCHNYGWAILILTLILKGLFTPLTHISYESMRKMQALQPKLTHLQQQYKNDPAKLQQKQMELYKRHKVNPLGGCLPMLLQIPIFIAFYQVLNDAIELKGAPFIFWIHDLAEPDRLFALPFALPFLGDSFNLLPLLMLASMIYQQKLSPQVGSTAEQTKMLNLMMPTIFGLMFYNLPSGLVLYWFVNNLLSIIHQVVVKRGAAIILHHDDES